MIVSLMTCSKHSVTGCTVHSIHIAACRLIKLMNTGFSPTVSNFNVLLKNCMITRDVSRAEGVMQQIGDAGLQVCACPTGVHIPAMLVLAEKHASMPLKKAAVCCRSGTAAAADVQSLTRHCLSLTGCRQMRSPSTLC